MATSNSNPPDEESDSPAPTTAAPRAGLLLAALAGIAAIGAFATLFAVWYRTEPQRPEDILRIALDEYVAGRYEIAQQLSERVTPDAGEQPELYRTREFLLGASGIQLARQQTDSRLKRQQVSASAPHLQRLVTLGFPPGRSAEGKSLLGLGLESSGQFDEAIEPLEGAIAEDPTYARRLLPHLAEARLRARTARMDQAMKDIDRFLNLPNLPTSARNDAQVLQARLLAKTGHWDRAKEILRAVQGEERRDELDIELARVLIGQARAAVAGRVAAAVTGIRRNRGDAVPADAKQALDEALALLEGVYHRNEREYGAAALYLRGIAHRLAGEHEEALGILASLRQSVRQPAEAVAAGIEEVELLTDNAQYSDAVLATRATIRDIGDPVMFDPTWLSLADFRSRLETVAEAMLHEGAYAEAIALAKNLPPIVPAADAMLIAARSHRQWGEATLAAAKTSRTQQRMRAEARRHFRDAGEAFSEVAKLHFERAEYVDLLWQAIDAYQAGRAYAESLVLLDDYLRYEQRSRKPRGLIAAGRSLLSVGRPGEAMEPLEDCIAEYPRDPLRYEARLLSAIARSELGQVDEPRQLLEENLFDGRLAPQSPLFRDSLFVLGDLLYRRALADYLDLTAPSLAGGRLSEGDQIPPDTAERFNKNQRMWEDAIARLEEAAYRDRIYDNRSRSRRASYLAAEAHHLAAHWPGLEASDPDTLESARRQLNQRRQAHLSASRDGFAAIRKQLVSDVGHRDELEPWEQGVLRNCFMGVADTLFEMGEIESAAAAYQQASQEFLNEPLALEALLQQARCYDYLGKQQDSKRIYLQAAKVLQRIPQDEDPRFARTTRYDRADWQTLIDWLGQT